MFRFPSGSLRFYRINSKSLKHVADTTANDIFGYSQLPANVDVLFLGSGQKDIMALFSNTGYYPVSLNSETAKLTAKIYVRLRKVCKRIILAYDMDRTGRRKAEEIVKAWNLVQIKLPYKDIADTFKEWRSFGMNVMERRSQFTDLVKKQTGIEL